ncbi:MAG: Y-family DNA polymerase [Planctomycetes bacterium]|nr:Y-family DNA polymerase [Planctomycetota bacterium]
MIALADANNFYASCEQVFNPALRGKPVVVLSNNDGVIVARSAEARALGVKMAQPYFEARSMLARIGARVLSSNYTLYDDMSNRLIEIYRMHSAEVEPYSIDECFMRLDESRPLEALGRRIRGMAAQWLGLPISVGIAATKTLAKLANRVAKRTPERGGVCVLAGARDVEDALRSVGLTDLWGVSSGYRKRLEAMGVSTPLELRDADEHRVLARLGVVGQRIVLELRGIPCIGLELTPPDKQNICCSRSFGEETIRKDDLHRALATFASLAAAKLRRQDLATGAITVFIGTNIHAPPQVPQYHASHGVGLAVPAYDTREIAQAALHCLERVYRAGHRYKKAGVMLHRLCRRERMQAGLFDGRDHARSRRLMRLMDDVNREWGDDALRIGSAAALRLTPGRTMQWQGKSDSRSPRYTTKWNELPKAKARAQKPPTGLEPVT